jgi:U3 small nucleolar RNA-associated protein 22
MNINSLTTEFIFCFQKRSREELGEEAGEEGNDPVDVLKAVGEVGKGFVRSVYFLKAPRLN